METAKFREKVTLGTGEELSIQASTFMYSTPRDNTGPYTSVEVGVWDKCELPSRWDVYKDSYSGDRGPDLVVYAFVPVVLVRELIQSRGGIVSGECPPLATTTYSKERIGE